MYNYIKLILFKFITIEFINLILIRIIQSITIVVRDFY